LAIPAQACARINRGRKPLADGHERNDAAGKHRIRECRGEPGRPGLIPRRGAAARSWSSSTGRQRPGGLRRPIHPVRTDRQTGPATTHDPRSLHGPLVETSFPPFLVPPPVDDRRLRQVLDTGFCQRPCRPNVHSMGRSDTLGNDFPGFAFVLSKTSVHNVLTTAMDTRYTGATGTFCDGLDIFLKFNDVTADTHPRGSERCIQIAGHRPVIMPASPWWSCYAVSHGPQRLHHRRHCGHRCRPRQPPSNARSWCCCALCPHHSPRPTRPNARLSPSAFATEAASSCPTLTDFATACALSNTPANDNPDGLRRHRPYWLLAGCRSGPGKARAVSSIVALLHNAGCERLHVPASSFSGR